MNNLIIFFSLLCASFFTGSAQSLSHSGAAHLKAAETLKSMASTTDDNLQVAEEYEKIIESDPNYAEAYLEAGRIYSTLVPQMGPAAYDRASNLFRHYAELRPAEASDVDAELIVLEAMLRKYNNGPNRLNGIWQWVGYNFYKDCLEIKNGGSEVRLLDPTWRDGRDIRDEEVSVNGDQCTIMIQSFWDNRPDLRKKGWTHYYDDCDGKADPGYPRYGTYDYNESLTTYYYVADLSKTPLVLKCVKIHTEYFLNGNKTYANTDNNPNPAWDRKLVKKQ